LANANPFKVRLGQSSKRFGAHAGKLILTFSMMLPKRYSCEGAL
jgi:hypothetical protein